MTTGRKACQTSRMARQGEDGGWRQGEIFWQRRVKKVLCRRGALAPAVAFAACADSRWTHGRSRSPGAVMALSLMDACLRRTPGRARLAMGEWTKPVSRRRHGALADGRMPTKDPRQGATRDGRMDAKRE